MSKRQYSVRHSSHLVIWDLVEYLGSSELSNYVLSENIESRLKIIFGFSLYTVPLLVTQVTYFRLELGDLEGRKPTEDGKVCYC